LEIEAEILSEIETDFEADGLAEILALGLWLAEILAEILALGDWLADGLREILDEAKTGNQNAPPGIPG